MTPGTREHRERRRAAEDGGEETGVVDWFAIRSADIFGDVQLNVGGGAVVRGHGVATVVGIVCCGWRNTMDGPYEDHARFHCGPCKVVSKRERRV